MISKCDLKITVSYQNLLIISHDLDHDPYTYISIILHYHDILTEGEKLRSGCGQDSQMAKMAKTVVNWCSKFLHHIMKL